MQKTYIVASMIAISTILFASAITSVRAYGTYNTTFDVNYDPYSAGWTELHGRSPLYGESIYRDITTLGKVSTGDIRLTPVDDGNGGYYPAGSTVVAGEADQGLALTLSTTWSTIVHAENILVDTFYQYGEFIYKRYGTNTTVTTGAIRYSNVTGYKVGSTVGGGDSDIGTPLVTFKSTTPRFEKFTNNLAGGGPQYDFARVYVDIFWTTDMVDNTPDGMRGYQIHMTVDPSVITPLGAMGGALGYVLYDFASINYPDLVPATAVLSTTGSDYLEMTEQILGSVATGAGDAWSGYAGAGTEKLVTLVFIPQSEFGFSPLNFNSFPASGDYQDAGTETWHAVNSYGNSTYNFVTPEFPLGIGVLMSMVALIPVVYVWRTRKKVIKP